MLGGLAAVLAAFHVIPSTPHMDDLTTRIYVGLFGSLILAFGVLLLLGAARSVLDARAVAPGRPFFLRLLCLVWAQVSLKTILGAIPYGLLAAQYILTWTSICAFPWATRDDLKAMMGVETLVVHSTPFLGLVYLMRPPRREPLIKGGCFTTMLAFYVILAWGGMGAGSAASFLTLTASKHLGFHLNRPSEREWVALGVRWYLNVLVFAGTLHLASRDVLQWGSCYFSILAAVEVVNVAGFVVPSAEPSRARC